MPSINGTFKIFVGNLDEKTSSTEIRPLFEKVRINVVCENYYHNLVYLILNTARQLFPNLFKKKKKDISFCAVR